MAASRSLGLSFALFAAGCLGDDALVDAGSFEDLSGPELPRDAEPVDAGATDLGLADAGEVQDSGPAELGPVRVDLENPQAPARLSDFRFFRLEDGRPEYNEGVVPYDLNTPLFSDYAIKWRALYVPPGATIRFDPVGTFDFPVGSAIVKSFAIAPDLRSPNDGVRILETRVLVRYADGWRAFPYLWREDLSDADYHVRGAVLPLEFVDPRGSTRTAQYLVPQRNQCLACHEQNDAEGNGFLTIIGPKARHLHRSYDYPSGARNQLSHLAELGWLEGLPPLDQIRPAFDFQTLSTTSTSSLDPATIQTAARDYLDINCAHCHNPSATQGVTSQLFLNFDNTDLFRLGVCKEPGSAGSGSGGRRFDIVPGDADASILVFRTESETAGEMMPLLGRSLRDDPAVEVLRAWIDQMPPESCD